MYQRLLVAIDESEVADRVLAAAKELALLSKATVWVLHLREREVIPQLGDVPSETGSEAHQKINKGVEALVQAGIDAKGEVRNTLFGHAAREIVADAKERDAGVIIMGSRGRTDLVGIVVGSTAHKVIHLSDRPVLVVR